MLESTIQKVTKGRDVVFVNLHAALEITNEELKLNLNNLVIREPKMLMRMTQKMTDGT